MYTDACPKDPKSQTNAKSYALCFRKIIAYVEEKNPQLKGVDILSAEATIKERFDLFSKPKAEGGDGFLPETVLNYCKNLLAIWKVFVKKHPEVEHLKKMAEYWAELKKTDLGKKAAQYNREDKVKRGQKPVDFKPFYDYMDMAMKNLPRLFEDLEARLKVRQYFPIGRKTRDFKMAAVLSEITKTLALQAVACGKRMEVGANMTEQEFLNAKLHEGFWCVNVSEQKTATNKAAAFTIPEKDFIYWQKYHQVRPAKKNKRLLKEIHTGVYKKKSYLCLPFFFRSDLPCRTATESPHPANIFYLIAMAINLWTSISISENT